MEKNFRINIQKQTVILYNPCKFKKKKSESIFSKSYQEIEGLINQSKIIMLRMDLPEYNFYFSDSKISENILSDYDCYLNRSIIVNNKGLIFGDACELDNSNSENLKQIDIANGFYNVHIFSKKDNVYFYFEKSNFKHLRVNFNERYELISDPKQKRYINSCNFNNFMLNNYYFWFNDKKDIKDKNNFDVNIGNLKLSSGRISVIDAEDPESASYALDNREYLDREIPVGEYPVVLSMRKSNFSGTYNTAIKIIVSDKEPTDYILASTNLGRKKFFLSSYYGGICDFDSLKDYFSIRKTFGLLQKERTPLTEAFEDNVKNHKDIIDTHNYFLLWDIPSTNSNIALVNFELNINSYYIYYGIDENDEVTSIYIPLINDSVFKYKDYTVKKDKEKFVDNKINEIREMLDKYQEKLGEDANHYINNIPEYIQIIIEKIIFEIKDLNLEKEFFEKLYKIFDEYPNITFYIKSDSIYLLMHDRPDEKDIIEDLLKSPTVYKVYLLARYLYIHDYKSKDNKQLFKALKKLKKSKNRAISINAKKRYHELTIDDKKRRKKLIIIIMTVLLLLKFVDSMFPVLHYNTMAKNDNYFLLTSNINSTDNKYRVYYNNIDGYETTKMGKNIVWFTLKTDDLNIMKKIDVEIADENIDNFKNKVFEEMDWICSQDTEYSHIECSNIVKEDNFKVNNIPYYYFTYSFVENDSFHSVAEFLLYKLDDKTTLVLSNKAYDITPDEFLELSEDIIASIKVKK